MVISTPRPYFTLGKVPIPIVQEADYNNAQRNNNNDNVRYFIFIIIIISFMQGIYTYIPETNHVLKEYSVSAILSLLLMVPVSIVPALAVLYFYVSTFRSMCAVPNMAVFCGFPTSWFPVMLLTYFLNDFEMVPVAPIIAGDTLVS